MRRERPRLVEILGRGSAGHALASAAHQPWPVRNRRRPPTDRREPARVRQPDHHRLRRRPQRDPVQLRLFRCAAPPRSPRPPPSSTSAAATCRPTNCGPGRCAGPPSTRPGAPGAMVEVLVDSLAMAPAVVVSWAMNSLLVAEAGPLGPPPSRTRTDSRLDNVRSRHRASVLRAAGREYSRCSKRPPAWAFCAPGLWRQRPVRAF